MKSQCFRVIGGYFKGIFENVAVVFSLLGVLHQVVEVAVEIGGIRLGQASRSSCEIAPRQVA